MNDILIDLLLKIYLYYPIGMPQIHHDYPGYKLFHDKIATKIDNITANKNTPWNAFISEAGNKFKNYKVFDFSFHQFPSYILKIELNKTIDNERETTTEIVVNVSMLTNHFTIFVKGSHKFLNYRSGADSSNAVQLEILYYKAYPEKKYFEICELLKNLVQKAYPDYFFVEHSLLFNAVVEGGVIYGQGLDYSITKGYSIYEYLFFNNINKENMVILE